MSTYYNRLMESIVPLDYEESMLSEEELIAVLESLSPDEIDAVQDKDASKAHKAVGAVLRRMGLPDNSQTRAQLQKHAQAKRTNLLQRVPMRKAKNESFFDYIDEASAQARQNKETRRRMERGSPDSADNKEKRRQSSKDSDYTSTKRLNQQFRLSGKRNEREGFSDPLDRKFASDDIKAAHWRKKLYRRLAVKGGAEGTRAHYSKEAAGARREKARAQDSLKYDIRKDLGKMRKPSLPKDPLPDVKLKHSLGDAVRYSAKRPRNKRSVKNESIADRMNFILGEGQTSKEKLSMRREYPYNDSKWAERKWFSRSKFDHSRNTKEGKIKRQKAPWKRDA